MAGVWIPVLASMKGFIAEVNRGAEQAAASAGSKLKKGLEDSTGDGAAAAAAKMAKAVEAQTAKISTARKAQAQAAADAEVAERKLENLRNSGTASASQIARVEGELATAKLKHENATNQLQRGEQDLANVRNGGQATASGLARAEDQLARSKEISLQKQGQLRTAELQLDEARAKAKSAADNVSNAELNLINVRDRYGANTKETAAAERELETAKKQAARADDQVAAASGKVKKARAEVANAADNQKAKTLGLKAAQEQAASSERKAGNEAATAGKKIRGMGNDMGYAEPKAKGLTSSLAGIAGKAGLAAGAFMGVQGVTGILSSGFERLQNIERAEIGFKNIGLTAQETEQQMAKLTEQVTGTSVSLSDAAKYSMMFAQSGVEMGKPMDDTIKAYTNLSAAAAGSSVDVGNVMTQISAAGRLMGGDAMQLQQAGINIYQYVADYMGKSVAEVKKLGEEGKITFEDVIGAINQGTGDLAKDMGETLSAKMANMKTAFAGLGAAILEPLMGPLTTAVEGVTNVLKTLVPVIRDYVAPAFGVLGDAFKAVWEWGTNNIGVIAGVAGGLSYFGTVLAGIAIAKKVSELGGMAMSLGKMAGTLAQVIKSMHLFKVAGKIATAVQWAWNTAMWANPLVWIAAAIIGVIAGLTLFFTKTETGRKAWAAFTDFLKSAWENTTQFFKSAYDAYIQPVWSVMVSAFNVVKDAMVAALGWMGAKFSEFATGVGQFYNTWIKPVYDALATSLQWLWQNVYSPILGFIGEKFMQLGQGISNVVQTVILAAWNVMTTVAQFMWQNVLSPVFEGIKLGFQLVADIISIAINATIIPAWQFMGDMITNVWTGIISPVWEFIKNAAGLLADVLTGNFDNIKNRFGMMGQAIHDTVHGVINAAMEFFKGIIDLVGQAWQGFQDIVSRVVEVVKDRIKAMVDNIGQIPGQIQRLFADAGKWLYSAGQRIISGLWDGMKNMWSSVKNWLSENLSFSAIGSIVGLSGGGIVQFASGGITEAYVQGGIRQLEAYANGGGRENHRAQIAPAGAWRVWAEPETGGEAYIPLASAKRARSTAILDEVANRFGYTLVDRNGVPYAGGYRGDLGPQKVATFAEGGVVSADDIERFVQGQGASRPLEGAPYVWGGSNWGDCSGAQSAIAAFAVGINPFPRKFATGSQASWLSAHGFTRGRGSAGDLRIGFKNGGPAGGHTAGTLPNGINVEMGGARGNGQYGGGAAGAWDSYFNEFFYLPMAPAFENVELDDLGDLSTELELADVNYTGVPDTQFDAAAASSSAYTTSDALDSSSSLTGSSTSSTGSAGGNDTISGTAGNLVSEIVSGHVADVLGVFGVPDKIPSWLIGMRDLGREFQNTSLDMSSNNATSTNSPRTSLAEQHAEQIHNEAVTSMTPAELQVDPQLKNIDDLDVTVQPDVPEWGPEFFVHEIARQAKAMNLGADGAKIGVATALVESGDPLKMYANNAVPESLNYRHDALGSDHDSVGLFQQRNNGAWGTVADRMDPFKSAGMFFNELVKFDWRSMDPGAAAQKVQRSAFPDRYGQKMGRAKQLVDNVGLFDQGGVLKDESLALNLSGKPEAVLTNDQWQSLDKLGNSLPEIVGGLTSSAVGGAGVAGIAAINSYVPGAGAALEPLVNAAAAYSGAVTSGWTQAFVTAAQQTTGLVLEPMNDTVGEFTAPVVDMANQVQAGVSEIQDNAGQIASGQSAQATPAPVVINVQNMEQAYDAKKRLEARALAGFM